MRRGERARGRHGVDENSQAPRRRVAASPRRIPASTYRLQLHSKFTFRHALAVIPHLYELGISTIYCSPIFRARAGSTHGYDIVDPTSLNPELGTPADFEALLAEVRRRGMDVLLDIVPNHMAAGADNPWWIDVLRHGPQSRYAHFFDIDWHSSAGKPNLENKVLLPVLARPYGEALEAGEIRLVRADDEIWVRYFDDGFPLSAHTEALLRKRDLSKINQVPDEVDRILEGQFYRLAFWRLAAEELNYRRFFDIGELIGVRVEDQAVFDATHELIRQWVSAGKVAGLRIDHIDGLYDPIRYLERLHVLSGEREPYVVVEKILNAEERLPEEMPVEGTTGYDFLNLVNSVFVDREGIESLRETYRRFTGIREDFGEIVFQRKKRAVARLFAGEVSRLSRRLAAIAGGDRIARDIPLAILVQSLIDITSSLPVYRTYTNSPIVSERDRAYIDVAVRRARQLSRDERRVPAYEFLRRLLVLDSPSDDATRDEWLSFVMQWQQLTGPATAKGFEDTALYVYHPLLSLNEVGGDPDFHEQTTGLEAFHRRNQDFLGRWPHTMNATTTHDTKRSEGARSRLNVLSELPDQWRRRLRRWSNFNQDKKKLYRGAAVPDPNEEILLIQTLLGSWPLSPSHIPDFKRRFKDYVVKAAREAKTHSSWIEPREEYERLLLQFTTAILRKSKANPFLPDFLDFQARIAFFGAINSLAQVVLKITSPGIPDFYQGSGLWDFSMVDPDNRRPIDYDLRQRYLHEVSRSRADHRTFLPNWRDGRVKLFVTHRALHFRQKHHELFATGDYVPLRGAGTFGQNLCTFARTDGTRWSVTVVPRLCTRIVRAERFPVGRNWADTRLILPREAPRAWRNVFTGEKVSGTKALPVSEILATFPVAILEALSPLGERVARSAG